MQKMRQTIIEHNTQATVKLSRTSMLYTNYFASPDLGKKASSKVVFAPSSEQDTNVDILK